MSAVETSTKPFEPGTTGWTARDLDDPAIEREWFRGRFEIVEGVLTKMPAAYFTSGAMLYRLVKQVDRHCEQRGPKGTVSFEVDIIVDEARVAVADAVFLTGEDQRRQQDAVRRAGKRDPRRTRVLVPPTLIIESISPGHEAHDQRTKRRWYAEFGVPNYWILDAYEKSLECLVLNGADYRTDQRGAGDSTVTPSAFPGLQLNLRDVWGD